MKTFGSNFNSQRAKITGAAPLWVLSLFDGTTTYYFSDRSATIQTPSTSYVNAWRAVDDWGSLREGVTSGLGEYSVGEYRLHLINDATTYSNNIVAILDAHLTAIETNPACLYCTFGNSEPIQLMFSGYLKDITFDKNDEGVSLLLQDATVKSARTVGTSLSSQTYPLSAPADINKLIPILFGTINKIPAVCVDAGWITTITVLVLNTDTTIVVSELPAATVVGKTIYIDSEQIYISAVNTGTKTVTVTRGYNSTVAVNHTAGSVVIEKKVTPLVWLCGDLPVTGIGSVFIRTAGVDVDITASCTKYIGSAGNQLSAYPGKAAVTIATHPAILNNIEVAIQNALGVNQGNHTHPTATGTTDVAFNSATILSGTWSAFPSNTPAEAVDGNFSTYMTRSNSLTAQVKFQRTTSVSGAAVISMRMKLYMQHSGSYAGGTLKIYILGSLMQTIVVPANFSLGYLYSNSFTLSAWSDVYAANTYILFDENATTHNFYEFAWEVTTGTATTYSAATGVALSGDLSMIGNSTASVNIAEALLCNVVNANQDTPKEACDWLLANYGPPGVTSVTSDNAIHTTAGNLNGCILEKRSVSYWLNRIAFEFRSRFKYDASGAATLIYRPDTLTSAKTVTNAMSRNITRKRTPYEDIVNVINLAYSRDWSNSANEPYTATVTVSDSTSQGQYGVHEKPDQFRFDFVTDATLADTIADYYLARYKDRHWQYELEAFLDNMELEYADQITIGGVTGSPVGVIIEACLTPGSETEPDGIKLLVEV